MTEKELKKLSRIDLLEMLLEQSKEVERLNTELEDARKKLKDRRIDLEEAGSIAEAALRLNGIFDMAQIAAGQYLDNIESLSQRTNEICDRKRQECDIEIKKKQEECDFEIQRKREAIEKECIELSQNTIRECEELKKQTEELCEKRIKAADDQVEEKWKVLSERLEQFCQVHKDVKELLSFVEKEDRTDEK